MKRVKFIVAVMLLPIFGLYVCAIGLFIWLSVPFIGEPSDRAMRLIGQPMRAWRTIGNWI